MNISVAIMAHPHRILAAKYLLNELSIMPFCSVDIVLDEKNEEWDTGKRSLLNGVGKGEWHIVIQDDAILTPFFYENVESAITHCPEKSLISFYTGQSRPWPRKISHAVSKAQDGDWLRYWLLLWGVGIAIPTDHIEPMLEFVDDREEPYDTRIGIFYQRNMLPVYYTMPSLVDHKDGESLIPGHGILPGSRIAHRPAIKKIEFGSIIIDM